MFLSAFNVPVSASATSLRYGLKEKNDIIWEFFPTWGGVFPNPKTFVNLPSIFLYAKLGPKWSKTCYIDHLGSFWALLDRFGTSASLPCSAIFGPKRAIMIRGSQKGGMGGVRRLGKIPK